MSEVGATRRRPAGVARTSRCSTIQECLDLGIAGGVECVPWVGYVDIYGYGRATYQGRKYRAHSLVWVLAGHELATMRYKIELDHICHDPNVCHGGVECMHRRCINIDHLALRSRHEQKMNSVQANHLTCQSGKHPWIAENIYPRPDGNGSQCRACHRERQAKYRAQHEYKASPLGSMDLLIDYVLREDAEILDRLRDS